MARIAGKGRAILGVHPEHHQRRSPTGPVHHDDGAPGMFADPVRVAGFEHQFVILDVLAPDVDAEHRERQAQTVIHDRLGLFNR